jgi:hypothetical protein
VGDREVNFVKYAKMRTRFWPEATMTARNFEQIDQELVLLLKEQNLAWIIDQAALIDDLYPVNKTAAVFK